MKFRKKPVVIEAVQLQRRFDWPDWFHDAVSKNDIITHGLGKFGEGPVYCEIKTLEGVMRAEEGDWIIRGVKNEIYPCKPDIFEMTYELAAAAPVAAPSAQLLEKIAAFPELNMNNYDEEQVRNLNEWGITIAMMAEEVAAAPVAAQTEPVEYQVRTRPMWRDEGEGWTEWRKCSPESYADYVRVPVLHDWQHEARALYTAPIAAPVAAPEHCIEALTAARDFLASGKRDGEARLSVLCKVGLALTAAKEAAAPVAAPDDAPDVCAKCGAGWHPHVCRRGPDWD